MILFMGYYGVTLLRNLREQTVETTLAVILKAFCCGMAAFLDSGYQQLKPKPKPYSNQDLPRENIVRWREDEAGDLLSQELFRGYPQDVEEYGRREPPRRYPQDVETDLT